MALSRNQIGGGLAIALVAFAGLTFTSGQFVPPPNGGGAGGGGTSGVTAPVALTSTRVPVATGGTTLADSNIKDDTGIGKITVDNGVTVLFGGQGGAGAPIDFGGNASGGAGTVRAFESEGTTGASGTALTVVDLVQRVTSGGPAILFKTCDTFFGSCSNFFTSGAIQILADDSVAANKAAGMCLQTVNSGGALACALQLNSDQSVRPQGPLVVGQLINTQQDDTSTGTVTDFALSATTTTVTWHGATALVVQGMTGGVAGRRVCWLNTSASNQSLSFAHETGTTVANRTSNQSSATATVTNNGNGGASSACYEYVAGTVNRWRETTLQSSVFPVVQANNAIIVTAGARYRDIGSAGALSANCTSGTGSSLGVGGWRFTVTVGTTSTACTITPTVSASANEPTCTISPKTAGDPNPGYSFTGTPASAVTLTTVTGGHTYSVDCTDH